MSLWLLLLFAAYPQQNYAMYLVEEIVYQVPGLPDQTSRRHIYIGKDVVRTDFEEEPLRLIYDMKLGTLIVVEMDKKQFYLSRPGRNKFLARSPLVNLVPIDDGMLTIRGNLVQATGRKAVISGADCREYKLKFRSKLGLETHIWATSGTYNRKEFKRIFHAAGGTKPPQDVKDVYSRILREIEGDPVRIVSTINQEGFEVVTSSTFVSINRFHKIEPQFFEIPTNFEIVQGEITERPWTEAENN